MQKYYKHIAFIFVTLIGLLPLIAQKPIAYNLSDISDLPDNEFYDILEDNHNYIWLAANKGLYRYNGRLYKKFSNPQQKAKSLFQLKLDSQNRLWCSNIYGQIFYVENNSLKLFYDANLLVKGQLSPFIILDDTIRLFTTQGVFDIDKTNKTVTKYLNEATLSVEAAHTTAYAFMLNTKPSNHHHFVYRIDENAIETILKFDSNLPIDSPKVFAFHNDVLVNFKSNGVNNIYHINTNNNNSKPLHVPKALQQLTIYNILNFNNNYWFLTTSGAYIYKLNNGKLEFIDQIFENESITDLLVDFNNNYWFTTLDNGVFVSPNLNIKKVDLSTLKDKITAACALKDNRILLGTNKGKLLFYNQAELVNTLQLPGAKIIGNLFFDELEHRVIVSINASESYVIDLETNTIFDTKNKFSVAKSFSRLNNNTLFYGNYKEGIVYYKPFLLDSLKIIRSNRVKTSLVINSKLLVSFIDGLFTFHPLNFSATELKYRNNSILAHTMANINDTVWLATQHKGLLKLKGNTLEQAKLSLPSKLQVNTIKPDGNILWLSTDVGLYSYNTQLKQLQVLRGQDGLNMAVDEFIVLKDYITIVSPNAFYLVPKNNKVFKHYKTSKITIESIKINDKDTLVQPNYKLPYNFNKIGITFNSNGFQSNQHVKYHYRVKEIDTGWHNIPLNTHFVNFNSLANGTYTFELKAQNVSAKNPVFSTPITFKISKPFWETYWFYTLVLLCFFMLIWLYFRKRLKQKERQRIAEIDKILVDKKITSLRLENLRSQMNPHFIFNALNSIQDYIISNEKELASSYLVKFSRLIRMYLDYSQQNEISLNEELNALSLYLELEKVRFEDELEFQIKIDNNLKTSQIKVPSLFIQPYVENALKHGLLHKPKDRKLKVEVKVIQKNKLQITVEDNGIGRKQSEKLKQSKQQHKPFATKANEERVHLYKNKLKRDITIVIEDLCDENKIPTGTKVVITMPI
ncbi:YXYXY domain-containing protein [Jejuia pallidilutea]|uniref:YXYXY domain-containing protein n=1 Tax=Jejuia pallidilutea TaxID=504487 RepID=A0A362WZI1_9FLAO|nr:histidine kinase [Jejuia pallidilutea]PQV45487.1 YXYXY domain-containing protein [Jejuia pallidilutea]